MKGILKSVMFVILLVLAMMSTGCYYRRIIDENEVGLHMSDGVSVDRTLGPGRHSDDNWWSELIEIDIGTKTNIWEDPDVATKDKQVIALTVGVTYRRGPSHDAIKMMWQTYRSECTDDNALWGQIQNRMARVVKNITTRYSLDELLGVAVESDVNRATVQAELLEELGKELNELGVTLIDAGINNIAPSEAYRARLEEKANAAAQAEIAKQQTIKLQEQLLQEKAQTAIELEKADRARQVAEKQNEIFVQSPQAFELERLKRLADVIGPGDKIYFVPPDSDITLVLGGSAFVK